MKVLFVNFILLILVNQCVKVCDLKLVKKITPKKQFAHRI